MLHFQIFKITKICLSHPDANRPELLLIASSPLTPPKYLICCILTMSHPVANTCGVWTWVNSWQDYLQVSLNKSNTLCTVYVRIYWSSPRNSPFDDTYALKQARWNVFLRSEAISLRSVQSQETASYDLWSPIKSSPRTIFPQTLY